MSMLVSRREPRHAGRAARPGRRTCVPISGHARHQDAAARTSATTLRPARDQRGGVPAGEGGASTVSAPRPSTSCSPAGRAGSEGVHRGRDRSPVAATTAEDGDDATEPGHGSPAGRPSTARTTKASAAAERRRRRSPSQAKGRTPSPARVGVRCPTARHPGLAAGDGSQRCGGEAQQHDRAEGVARRGSHLVLVPGQPSTRWTRSASKQVWSPVWQAAPTWSTMKSSVSPSQSRRTSLTHCTWPDVSPLTQYSRRERTSTSPARCRSCGRAPRRRPRRASAPRRTRAAGRRRARGPRPCAGGERRSRVEGGHGRAVAVIRGSAVGVSASRAAHVSAHAA